MRLSQYPHVILRLACHRCSRKGQYRIVRLAERYGSDILLTDLMAEIAKGCPKRVDSANIYDRCGAYFVDLGGNRPPVEHSEGGREQRVAPGDPAAD